MYDSNVVSLKAAQEEDWNALSNVLSIGIKLCTQDPFCNRSMAFAARGRTVQNGTQPVSDLTQTRDSGWATVAWR